MSDAPRPTLKLKFGKKPSEPPAEPTPLAPAEASQPKLTLKIGKPKAQTQATEEKPKKKKPTKKRPADNATQPEPVEEQQGPKRLKLSHKQPGHKPPGLQSIRIKNKGVVAHRPVGVGYDSEASDTEADPSIEEQFILRMLPGEDCESLRQAIAERKFGGNDFVLALKALDREGRRAVLTIRNKMYAASLVDLPCIIEGMKSWDRRGWYKSADICQMLLVLGQVSSDQEALEYPLPAEIEHPDDKTLQYPHGLAPPLKWVRKRRFRDRVSSRTIEQVEKAVEELVAQDETSVFPPRFELVDSASLNRAEGFAQDEFDYYDEEQDAEGEADEEMMDDFDDDLAAEMEAALAGEDDASGIPADAEQAETPSANPQTTTDGPPEGMSSDDEAESEEGGDDPDDDDDDLDDEQLEQQRQQQQSREEIAELEALIRTETAQWERVQNLILRNKMGRRIQELKKDLSLKKVSAGLGDDTDV